MNRDEFTIAEHHFKTTDGLHTLYVHEWGNPHGKPILYVHGYPGDGCKEKNKLFFDPKKFRVIFLDQRGAGKSVPSGSIDNNTMQYLLEDIEMVRTKLKIDKWAITGESWGSTLSLCYAIKHPDRVSRLIIGAIWLGTDSEFDWLFGGGWRDFFPDLWEQLLQNTPKRYHQNPGQYHLNNVFDPKSKTSNKSLFELSNVEFSLVHMDEKKVPLNIDEFDVNGMKVEMHYLKNSCFIDNDHIIANADKLTMPINIIQGRYDMVCTPKNAYKLHQSLPNSTLTWTLDGHASSRASSDVIGQTIKMI